MKKSIILLSVLMIAAGLRAQNSTPADSAQIRLNEAHDLYTHGLITAEEYATIRAQYAGVKRDTQPILL